MNGRSVLCCCREDRTSCRRPAWAFFDCVVERVIQQDSHNTLQSAPTDEFDRIDGGGRRRLATSFFFFSCPVSYYCKEKKNLHAAQSTGIYWAGLYRSPSQKRPRNEKAAKKENGKEKAKEKKRRFK